MKSAKYLFALVLSLCLLNSYSQGNFVKESVGEIIPREIVSLGPVEDGTIPLTKYESGNYKVIEYNTLNLERIEEYTAAFGKTEDNWMPLLRYVKKTKYGYKLIYQASKYYEKETKLFISTVDFSGNASEITELVTFYGVRSRSELDMYVSEDGNRIAFFGISSEAAPVLKVYDENVELVYSKELQNPFQEKFSITNARLSNSGDFVIAGYRQNERDLTTALKYSAGYAMLKVSQNASMKVFDLKTADRVYSNINFDFEEDKLLVYGAFSESSKDLYVDQVYGTQVDLASMQATMETQFTLASNTMSQLDETCTKHFRGANGSTTNNGLAAFKFKDFIRFEDGMLVVIAERDVNRVKGSASASSKMFGEILVLKLDSKNNLIWEKSIFKVQQNIGEINSYCLHVAQDNVYLFYNETLKNFEKLQEGVKEKYRPSRPNCIVVAKLSSKGELVHDVLPADIREGYLLAGGQEFYVDDDKLILKLNRGSRYRLGLYTL